MNRQRNVTGLSAAGLRLEFTPMKIGARVTNKGGYFIVIPADPGSESWAGAGIQDVIDVQTIMTLLVSGEGRVDEE